MNPRNRLLPLGLLVVFSAPPLLAQEDAALVRARHEEMGAGWDLLMIMKPDARGATYGELGDALDAALSRAGVREA